MTFFAFFQLWPAALAAGIGAISIPVIIHLINRRRYKIVPWAAMKFLLAAQKQTRKRMRIEQLLLLFVRMLILGLVVLAMWSVTPLAEGFWSYLNLSKIGKSHIRAQRIHHVLVLDASLSMNQVVGGQSAFETAKALAIKKIQDNPSGDGYSVLLLKDSPSWLVGEISQSGNKVIREIEAVKPSHGNSSLAAALNAISAKLGEGANRFPVQAVYFFTDLQKSTWMEAALNDIKTGDDREKNAYLDISKKAATVFVDVGPPGKGAPNLAVTSVSFDQPFVTSGTEQTLTAAVEYYGEEPKKEVRVEVLVGKARENPNDPPLNMRVVRHETTSFQAGGRRMVPFEKFQFPGPGTYAVQVKVSGDPLEQDDARTTVITVRETIPVLVVNGKHHPDRFMQAAAFVKLALNPFDTGDEMKKFPLRPRVVTPSEFSGMSDADLKDYDCIFWTDVGTFGKGDVDRLDRHVRRGGGFIVSLGDTSAAKLELYNRLLFRDEQGLLPGRLMRQLDAPKDHHFYLNASDESFKLPPLEAFSDVRFRLSLRIAQFHKFIETQASDRARIVMTFMPEATVIPEKGKSGPIDPNIVNKPALIEWSPPLSRAQLPALDTRDRRPDRHPTRYRGKVLLFTSTTNVDWTSWPGSPSFLAMVNEMTRVGVSGRLREQGTTVGGVLESYLPGNAEADVRVHYPASLTGAKPANVRTQVIDEISLFHFADTDTSGVYRVETPSGSEIPFAVNVPGSSTEQKGTESDLARVDEVKLIELYPGWKLKVVPDAVGVNISSGDGEPQPDAELLVHQPVGPFIANIAFLALLGLLFLEIVLAWLFGHYTSAEGTMTPGGVSNFTSNLIAACVAVLSTIFFALGVTVVWHATLTGDFLGFLPEIVRTYVEYVASVPPIQPGEGTRWNYNALPFLFDILSPRNETWLKIGLSLGAAATIFFTYRAEAPKVSLLFKMLLGALRLYMILLTVWFLLPKPQLAFEREAWPDLVLMIDTTRSMGEADVYKDPAALERAKKLGERIRDSLIRELPERIRSLEAELDTKAPQAEKDQDMRLEVDSIRQRIEYWKKQQGQIEKNEWKPSRLQLVQAILSQEEPHWLKTLLRTKESRIHVYVLDAHGRAIKLHGRTTDPGEIIDPTKPKQLEEAAAAIAALEPIGNDSRLGTAVRQVIDQYRGAGLSNVIMFTDGVTTRDETIAQASEYAALKGVSLYFIGLGDERGQLRDLKLHDLQMEDSIYVGDTAVIEVRLTGEGYKDLTVPVVLRVKGKDGKVRELKRELVPVDPSGKSQKVRFRDQPKEIGRRTYIIEVEPPKLDKNDKPHPPANLRLERTIEVIDTKQIKVLYVEGQPRYEYRYIKFLMEREAADAKKNKSIELKVLLLDADDDFAKTDDTALFNFPPTLDDLNRYDVVILGDCDPNHKKLKNHLKDIAHYVRGENDKGQKGTKSGGGLLFIAGSFHNPHRYLGTPLADVIPVEPLQAVPPPEAPRPGKMNPELTPAGRVHPIFRFSPDEGENVNIWQALQPMHWNATGYKTKPLAEVLAVHPSERAVAKRPNQDDRHPLIVQHFVGTGRSMFFGFDETWRWRIREHEPKFNNFWIQTMRYLSRGRSTRTDLRLDRQTPYRTGEPIKVTVRFPDNTPGGAGQPGPKINEKTEVKVTVAYLPTEGTGKESEVHPLTLAKVEGSWGTYEGTWNRTREGKYRFRLTNPDVSSTQPDGEKPSAEAIVELPPGELEKLRMNYQELTQAADATQGRFYTLANSDRLLTEMQRGPVAAISPQVPPELLWNQWWVFALVLFLMTSEWILRKFKHLL